MYLSPDRARQSRIFLEAYNEVQRQNLDLVHAWFHDALPEPRLQSDCAKAFRSSILSRNLNDGMHAAVVNVFYLLSRETMLRLCIFRESNKYQPAIWIMKALQRILCASEDRPWQDHLLMTSLSGIA